MTATEPNPLRLGLRRQRSPEPAVMVIFGATGDLTQRKLLPALYNLAFDHLLPPSFAVIGVGRRPIDEEAFRDSLRRSLERFSRRPVNDALWESFARRICYQPVNFDDPGSYHELRVRLDQIDGECGTGGNRVFYLALPPLLYEGIIERLGVAGLAHRPSYAHGWTRIIIEKPFGHDLASARSLNALVDEVFGEEQVFRIDHYLGKETVQNILVFRFANGIFEPIWSRNYVEQVQITVAETVGIEGRATYYEETGATRDMIENHLLQLLALTAMEPPVDFEADAVRDEKVKVLRAIEPIRADDALRVAAFGQYGPGAIGGQPVPGYREEPGVDPQSQTETYVALKLAIDNWRWAGVPFYLRTGKRLPRRVSEIAIQFKRAPHALFAQVTDQPATPNVLALRIQPDEGISLTFSAKSPGPAAAIRPVHMDFLYGTAFASAAPEAYERLILDCLLGDSTLFTRRDEVEVQWALVTPLLEGKQAAEPFDFPNYEAGTWGPAAADDLLHRDGREWIKL